LFRRYFYFESNGDNGTIRFWIKYLLKRWELHIFVGSSVALLRINESLYAYSTFAIQSINFIIISLIVAVLSVIFLSGIQHYAESPEGMSHVSPFVKEFLRTLPDSWDDVKFIEGFPGKDVVLGRKFGNKWYIAGINGDTTTQKTFDLDLSKFKMKKGHLITDGAENASFAEEHLTLKADTKKKVTVKPAGGFVLVLE